MKRSRPSFPIPGSGTTPPKGPGGRALSELARREAPGPTYRMVPSHQRHDGEPPSMSSRQGTPLLAILAAGPQMMSIAQRVHGAPPDPVSRLYAFLDASGFAQGVNDVLAESAHLRNFSDRRDQGRRYRPTQGWDDVWQEPHDTKGWQADVPAHSYRSY
jgi:hypothetical protein